MNRYYIQAPNVPRNTTKLTANVKIRLTCVEGDAVPFFDVVAAPVDPELFESVFFVVVVDPVAIALTAFGVFVAGNRVVVLPSITTTVAPKAREMVCPSTVMMPPGVSEFPSIT